MCLNNSRNPNHTLIELAWSPCTTLLQRGWEEGVVNWWASGLMFFSLFKLHFALSHFSFTLRPQWRRPDCWSFLTFPLPAKIHQCQVFHESLKKRETDPLFASKTLFRFRIFGTYTAEHSVKCSIWNVWQKDSVWKSPKMSHLRFFNFGIFHQFLSK